jgi:uncharacterized paraquat-inducible protein A
MSSTTLAPRSTFTVGHCAFSGPMTNHPSPMTSARSAPPRAVCPECGAVSTLTELFACLVVPGMAQCPRCEIGSPAHEWSAP